MIQLLRSVPVAPLVAKRPDAPSASPAASGNGTIESVLAFGRFRLLPLRRQLLADGVPVELGARAFDVLVALVESRGLLVLKDELMSRVWPDTIVEENNLPVQISAVRKALGADRGFIATACGRGYRFTAEVRSESSEASSLIRQAPTAPADIGRRDNLPPGIADFVGRDAELRQLAELVAAHRLVTVTGPVGVGKSRLGVEAARQLLTGMADGVWHADLAALSDPARVPETVVRCLGLEQTREMPAHWMAAALRQKRLLVVLDNCDHLVDAVATTAEWLLRTAPEIRILATSQEPLQVEGERIFRLAPLVVSGGADGEPRESAVELLLSRVRSADPDFHLDARTMHVAATICRRLDGLPLAIDLAAARAATLGLEAVAAGMDDRFRILTGGRRTDPPHHRTLEAAFDWSYDLLSDTGRAVASSLATLSGAFTLEEAIAVAGAGPESRASVLDGIADLVGKSLLGIDHREGATQYRFLDTTRAYLVRKARAAGVGAPGEAEPSRASSTALVRSFQKPLSKIQGPWRAHR